MKVIVTYLIRTYQFLISPLLGPSCRYFPTCSEYALVAIQTHGLISGSFLTVKRVLRCHPGCEGGLDPVPDKACHCTTSNKT